MNNGYVVNNIYNEKGKTLEEIIIKFLLLFDCDDFELSDNYVNIDMNIYENVVAKKGVQ